MATMIHCPVCGKLTDPKLASCPHCGARLQPKTGAKAVAPARGRQTCPNCKALVQEGDIICVVCGTNLLTGQRVGPETRTRPPRRVSLPWIVGGGVGIVLLVVVGSFWAYVISRDPFNQAMRLIGEGQYLEAQDVLSAYVERVDDERALVELGKLQFRNSAFPRAAESFERAVQLNPNNTEAAFWAVASLDAAGRTATIDQQIRMLEHVVTVEPENRRAWYLLALAHGANGDFGRQIEALEHLISLSPDDARLQWALGTSLALHGEYQRADQVLASVQGENAPVEVAASRGFLSVIRGLVDPAIQQLSVAADQQGLSIRGEALTLLGRLYIEQGRFQEAERRLQEALTLRRDNETARYLLAQSLRGQRGLAQNALSTLEDIARGGGPYAGLAAVQAAEIHLELGNPERAQELLNDPRAREDGGAAYFTAQGRVYAIADNTPAAQEAFTRAMTADPGYAPAYLEMGLLYVKRDTPAEALRYLDRYLELIGPDAQGPQLDQVRALARQLRESDARV